MSTIIVGGGITGLSAAWTLARQGGEVTLIEPGPFGGLLRTERVGDCIGDCGADCVAHRSAHCIVECGADSWIRAKRTLRDLAVELGLGDEIVPCNDANRGTFLLRHGKLVAFPRGLRTIAPTEWQPIAKTSLVGWPTKLRMFGEIFRSPSDQPDRSVSDFVRDHFGSEALEYMAEPLFAGVYGASPEDLSAVSVLPKLVEYERTLGSVIRGALREPAPSGPVFESLKGGLGRIPEALVRQLEGRVRFIRERAESVEPGRVRVNGVWIEATDVILACGAHQASALLAGSRSGELLARIPHSSATIFAFAFPRSAFATPPRGFGFLIPRKERQTIMAGTWVTNKFPHRAPADQVVVRCFTAGDHSETLIPDVLADLKRIAAIDSPPLFSRVYRWPHSLPLFRVGHQQLVRDIVASLPSRISVAGAFLGAVGMPDCARSGAVTASRIPRA